MCPENLAGVSKVYRFPYYECANAVGAAVAQVAGCIDAVQTMEDGRSMDDERINMEAKAIALAISNGADPSTVTIIESESLPIAYSTGRCRFVVKAAGDWIGISATFDSTNDFDGTSDEMVEDSDFRSVAKSSKTDVIWEAGDILQYRPEVINGEWWINELDLDFLAIGTYILGCGGGGDPQICRLALKNILRGGSRIRVVDLSSLAPDDLIGWGGHMGSPEVGSERLLGNEYSDAARELLEFLKVYTFVPSKLTLTRSKESPLSQL